MTHTSIFQRESYSSLVRNHCSLFSIPFSLSYFERRFVPKHNPHLCRVQRVFWSLASFGELSKEVGEAWWMQLGVLWDPESQTRHNSEKPYWSRSLEVIGTSGRLGLEGLLLTHVSQLIVQWIDYRLEGQWRGFSLSSSIFFLITHRRVILCLHSLFPYSCALLLLFVIHVYATVVSVDCISFTLVSALR